MIDTLFPLYAIVFVSALLITSLVIKKLIPVLSQSAKQPIYTEGPSWHIKKSGTPTMGGLAFIISTTLVLLPCCVFLFAIKKQDEAWSLMLCQLYAIMNSLVGIIDDAKKLRYNQNKGLSAASKLLLQAIAAFAFLFVRYTFFGARTTMSFSFGEIDFGVFYYPISLIILLGVINCANLTDGIDGLASSVAFSIAVSLLYISSALNDTVSILSSALIGICVAFLVFNLHPAKIFMGDTGSLYLGALITSCAFALNNPIIILFVAGVYVLEGVSVVLQVLWYKMFKKRIFRMAPFHHHLEQHGLEENKICIISIILTFVFSIPAYIFYLP